MAYDASRIGKITNEFNKTRMTTEYSIKPEDMVFLLGTINTLRRDFDDMYSDEDDDSSAYEKRLAKYAHMSINQICSKLEKSEKTNEASAAWKEQADVVIGRLQNLVIDLDGLIQTGKSESAIARIQAARNEDWKEMRLDEYKNKGKPHATDARDSNLKQKLQSGDEIMRQLNRDKKSYG